MFGVWVWGSRVWRHSLSGCVDPAVYPMWCSQTSRASPSGLMRSNTGARGRPLTCFTASAATTVYIWGAHLRRPRRRPLSHPPLGGRRDPSALRTMRRGGPRRGGGRLLYGIRLTSRGLSRSHGHPGGALHCCAVSTIGSGRPLIGASAAPASPGSGWSVRGVWCWILGSFRPLSPQLGCWWSHRGALLAMAHAACRRGSWEISGTSPFSSSILCRMRR